MKCERIVHCEEAAPCAVAAENRSQSARTIKLGVDIHRESYVAVAQHGHEHPKPPRKFLPADFVPWVERLIAGGHEVVMDLDYVSREQLNS